MVASQLDETVRDVLPRSPAQDKSAGILILAGL